MVESKESALYRRAKSLHDFASRFVLSPGFRLFSPVERVSLKELFLGSVRASQDPPELSGRMLRRVSRRGRKNVGNWGKRIRVRRARASSESVLACVSFFGCLKGDKAGDTSAPRRSSSSSPPGAVVPFNTILRSPSIAYRHDFTRVESIKSVSIQDPPGIRGLNIGT